MVRAKESEDDLYALAAKAGSSEAQTGLSVGPIFLEPEPDERGLNKPAINQKGDDPGFETRVKPPAKPSGSRTRQTSNKEEPKKPGRPRGSASERSLAEIEDALGRKFEEFFGYLSIGLPVTGVYGVDNSPKAVSALMSIAKRRPRVLAALARVADGADAMDIASYVMGVAVAVQVDLGRVQPDHMVARATGVTRVVEEYFANDDVASNPHVTEQMTHGAPRFQPV